MPSLQMVLLPIVLKRNLQLSATSITNNNVYYSKFKDKEICKLFEKFLGILDGDGYFDIGAQKQYN